MKRALLLASLSLAACSNGTDSAALTQTRGEYRIAVCKSAAGEAPSYDLAVSLDATKLSDGSWKANAVTVKGLVAGTNVAVRSSVKRVGGMYDIEPGIDGYYGINYFRFVAEETAEGSRDLQVSFVDDAKAGSIEIRLSDSLAQKLDYQRVACDLQNTEELLKKLQAGGW